MSYKCVDCGYVFEEGEQFEWEENHGLDAPPYEKWSGCPICKGDYEKTKTCLICGEKFLEDEMTDGVCENCIEELKDEYRHNPEKCFDLSKEENVKIEINYFLSCMFTEKQIEEILIKQLKAASTLISVDCTAFLEADKSWLEEKIVEEVKKQ